MRLPFLSSVGFISRLPQKLKQRALPLKEQYDRELAAWKRSLTPVDIAQENIFRLAQRNSGKSRLKNINDPNAPKRPPTVYIMFLQAIRADPRMAREVFGDVTDVTRQSVLAADKWRSMADDQKQVSIFTVHFRYPRSIIFRTSLSVVALFRPSRERKTRI